LLGKKGVDDRLVVELYIFDQSFLKLINRLSEEWTISFDLFLTKMNDNCRSRSVYSRFIFVFDELSIKLARKREYELKNLEI